MPNFRLILSNEQVAAICDQRGYEATVRNPTFNSAIAEDPATNPRTIPNPVTKDVFVAEFLQNAAHGEAAAGKRKARDTARSAEDTADRTAVAVTRPVIS